jgi:hypothetical protein
MRACCALMLGFGLWSLMVPEPALAGAAKSPPNSPPLSLGSEAALARLPNAPEKALVLKYCADCHDVDWIVRSGGTVEGWTNRIQRMIRGGAMIPKEQIPMVAAYLAKALPERPPPRSDVSP